MADTEKKNLIVDFTKEEFVDFAINNFPEFEKYTQPKIAEAIINFNLSDKGLGSLKLSKPKLQKIIKDHDKPPETTAKVHTSDTSKVSSEVLNFLDDLKVIINGSKINSLLKKWSVKALDSFISKVASEEQINKLGTAGNGFILFLTAIDIVFGLERVTKFIKEKIGTLTKEKEVSKKEDKKENDQDK